MDTNNKVVQKKVNEKKVGFGIADVLIILLVLALVGGAAWFFFGSALIEYSNKEQIQYEVRLTDVRDELVPYIKTGDVVYDGTYGEKIGKVESVRTEVHTIPLLNKETDELVNAPKSGYSDVYITITVTAQQKDFSYYVNDTKIKVGELVNLRLVDFCGQGYCTTVSKVKGGAS